MLVLLYSYFPHHLNFTFLMDGSGTGATLWSWKQHEAEMIPKQKAVTIPLNLTSKS